MSELQEVVKCGNPDCQERFVRRDPLSSPYYFHLCLECERSEWEETCSFSEEYECLRASEMDVHKEKYSHVLDQLLKRVPISFVCQNPGCGVDFPPREGNYFGYESCLCKHCETHEFENYFRAMHEDDNSDLCNLCGEETFIGYKCC